MTEDRRGHNDDHKEEGHPSSSKMNKDKASHDDSDSDKEVAVDIVGHDALLTYQPASGKDIPDDLQA